MFLAMKKLLLLIATIFLMASCNSGEVVLLQVKKQLNSQCPMVVDEITTLKNVEYEPGDMCFIYNYTIDETKCPMSTIKERKDVLAENIKAQNSNSANKTLMDVCIKADVFIIYQYTGSESGEKCAIEYYPKTQQVH